MFSIIMLYMLHMNTIQSIFASLKQAQARLALEKAEAKNRALAAVAAAIARDRALILSANGRDVEKARTGGMKESLVDRLLLNEKRIEGIIEGIEIVIKQGDPIGKIYAGWTLPNGLLVERVSVPVGVAAIIYESRPNVTVDCAVLAYKAGCSILLRGSSSALESNRALVASIRSGLEAGGGIAGAVALSDSAAFAQSPDQAKHDSRRDIDEILGARGWIDVVLPRGGRELIRRVVENARIPVIETGEGNCHIYVEPSAEMGKAVDIIINAKLQKPGICNAVETLLVHRDALSALMPLLVARLAVKAEPAVLELRCDAESKEAIAGSQVHGFTIKDADEEDWGTEFLDNILAIKTVGSCEEAITHINRYGTRHSEAILTNDLRSSGKFRAGVDAACVYVNASTRFTDGGMFGFGAELGISTNKLHTRGPMGLEALTTFKYVVSGEGQVRS
jgi:glutamate-5-semialdehyde dehydrogenase